MSMFFTIFTGSGAAIFDNTVIPVVVGIADILVFKGTDAPQTLCQHIQWRCIRLPQAPGYTLHINRRLGLGV